MGQAWEEEVCMGPTDSVLQSSVMWHDLASRQSRRKQKQI